MSELLEGIPNVIYKYRDWHNIWNKRTLFNYELYMASMSKFNDPFEGKLPFQYYPEDLTPEKIFLKLLESGKQMFPDKSETEIHEYAYNRQVEDFLNDDKHMDFVQNRIIDSIENLYGILSLAECPLNYLMWSHYSNSHTGFALGFDKFMLFDITKGAMGKVIYTDEFPKMSLFDSDSRPGEFHSLLCTKSPVWEYEAEVRVTKHNAANAIIPYPKEMIKEIYLGVSMLQEHKNEIIEFVKMEDLDCEIIELSLSKSSFMLDQLRIY